MSVTLRPATLDDLDAVIEIMLDATRHGYRGLVPDGTIAALTPELITRLWTKTLAGDVPGTAVLAVGDDGGALGVTRYASADDGTGTVHSLYVSPRAQRLGIGARLLSEATARLREGGATTLRLWVIAANTPSIAFYRSQGWTPDGTTRVQPGFDVDEIRLEYTGPGPRPASGEENPLAEAARELTGSGPGAPAGVAMGLRTGAGGLSGVAGFRALGGNPRPLTVGTRHDLASVTKILATTTALIGLVSSRDVRLDDPVTRYLPGFCGDGREAVTVRQLLQHRGGLWEWQPLYLDGRTGTEALRHAQKLPLRYRPGTGRHYSDLGFILLGRIVEATSGLDLASAVRALVTEPLGLTATRYAAPASDDVAVSASTDGIERRMVATGEPYPVLDADTRFGGWRDRPIDGEVNDGNAFHAFGGVSGHAGLFSTLDDLLTYATALARFREHDTLWDPRVVETFLAAGPDPEQALGFRRYRFRVGGEDSVMYGHPGFVGCAVGFSPETGTALALCSNRLLASGTPTPNDDLWSRAREAATTALSDPHRARGTEPSRKHEGDNE